jgi:hypothetical protein
VRASRVLAGGERTDPDDRPEATLALRDLFVARPTLGFLGEAFADGLLARPTDGAVDAFADGYRAPSTRRCARHVCVHWTRTGPDAATDAWAATTLRIMERVWRHHVDRLGYRPPARDGRRGGDSRFDVYLKDVGSRGLYGYCAPESRVPGEPKQASGYCVLDDDFARRQFGRAPKQTLKVTAAHEFFHAVQFAYDVTEDPWLLESTATWIEDRFADRVDDNRAYLQFGQVARPGTPLDLFETTGYAHYGNWTFWQYLSDRFGVDVVRRVWNGAGTGDGLPDEHSSQALAAVLRAEGGLPRVFAAYAAANTVPAHTYRDGDGYPTSELPVRRLNRNERRTRVQARVDHLTSRSVRFEPTRGLGRRWRITLEIDGPDRRRAPAAHLVIHRADGSLTSRRVALTRAGHGKAVVRFDRRSTRSVTLTLANGSTRFRCDTGTTLTCAGTPLDQRQKFVVTAFVTRRPR